MNAKHYFIIIVLFVLSCVAAMAETTQQFVKVTDASALKDGDEIIFANTQFQVALGVKHLTSSSCHPKFLVKEFSYFLMPCHQHCLGVNLLVQR